MTDQALCVEKHKRVDERLEVLEGFKGDMTTRMEKQENSAVRTEVVVQHLCKRIDSLITVLITGFIGIFGSSIAFVVWYIQSLPR